MSAAHGKLSAAWHTISSFEKLLARGITQARPGRPRQAARGAIQAKAPLAPAASEHPDMTASVPPPQLGSEASSDIEAELLQTIAAEITCLDNAFKVQRQPTKQLLLWMVPILGSSAALM